MPATKAKQRTQEEPRNHIPQHRPSHLAYRAKDGLYTTHVPTKKADFAQFAETILEWVRQDEAKSRKPPPGKATYRVLDTFNGNFLGTSTLQRMFEKKLPVEVLLLDPLSRTGALRAKALHAGNAVDRAKVGLKKFLAAVSDEEEAEQWGKQSLKSLLGQLRARIKEAKLPITLKFYNANPSRPMLFCGDIVLAGNYRFGKDSLKLPWQVFVDDPDYTEDSYDCCSDEFEELWVNDQVSYEEPGRAPSSPFMRPRLFVSYAHEDTEAADHVELILLRQEYFEVVRDESALRSGRLTPAIRREIDTSDMFLVLLSQHWRSSEWCPAELERFVDVDPGRQDKVVALRVDETPQIPGYKDILVRDGVSRAARHHFVNSICEDAPPVIDRDPQSQPPRLAGE